MGCLRCCFARCFSQSSASESHRSASSWYILSDRLGSNSPLDFHQHYFFHRSSQTQVQIPFSASSDYFFNPPWGWRKRCVSRKGLVHSSKAAAHRRCLRSRRHLPFKLGRWRYTKSSAPVFSTFPVRYCFVHP